MDVIDLVGIGDSNRAAIAHVRYLNGWRVSDSKSSWAHGRRYSGCSICQWGWMSKMSVCSDGWISHADVGLARARERRIDGFRLRGYLRQITVATKNIVGCRRDGMGLKVRDRRDWRDRCDLVLQCGRHSDVTGIGRSQNTDDYKQLK